MIDDRAPRCRCGHEERDHGAAGACWLCFKCWHYVPDLTIKEMT